MMLVVWWAELLNGGLGSGSPEPFQCAKGMEQANRGDDMR